MAAKLGKKSEEPGIDLDRIGKPDLDTERTEVTETEKPSEPATAVATQEVVTGQVSMTSCTIEISMLPAGTQLTGYMASMRSASFDLPPHLCDRFRRFVAGLHQSHATYPGVGGKTMHVDTAADAMKWLISQIPE